MAGVDIDVAGRRYHVACRDGEEAHLLKLAQAVDARARDAASALGNLTEGRQLLFAALLLADDLQEARSGGVDAAPQGSDDSPDVEHALERVAERLEQLAARLEMDASAS